MQLSAESLVQDRVTQTTDLSNQENVDRNLPKTATKPNVEERHLQRKPLSTLNSSHAYAEKNDAHQKYNNTLSVVPSGVRLVTGRTSPVLKSPRLRNESTKRSPIPRSSGLRASHRSSLINALARTASVGRSSSLITRPTESRGFGEMCRLQPEFITATLKKPVRDSAYPDSDIGHVAKLLNSEVQAALAEADEHLAVLYQNNKINEESDIAW